MTKLPRRDRYTVYVSYVVIFFLRPIEEIKMLNKFSFTIPCAMVVWCFACSEGGSKEPSDTASESLDSDTVTDFEIYDSDDKDTVADSSTETVADSETESDTESESDSANETDCSLLDDFDPCGDNEICFEETCVSFTENVVDENTTGITYLGNLNVVSGRLFASHSHTEGMLISHTDSQILELAGGGVKGEPSAEIEGGYAALAGTVALGNPRVF